jgi:hypothetical protein
MSHEQNLTRRSLVAGLGAAIPAAAVAAPALAGIDPIYAAIEAHKAALKISQEASAAREEVEAPFFAERDKNKDWDILSWETRWRSDPIIQAAVDRGMAGLATEEAAFNALLETTPTTEAGRLALGRYGCEMAEAEDGAPITGANPAYRVLAALVGISTADPPMDDDEDKDEAEA